MLASIIVVKAEQLRDFILMRLHRYWLGSLIKHSEAYSHRSVTGLAGLYLN